MSDIINPVRNNRDTICAFNPNRGARLCGYTHNTAECEHLCRSQAGPSPNRSARDAVVTPNPPARRARFDPIDDALRFQGYPGRIHGTSNTLARHEEEQQSPQSSPSANAATLTSQRHPDPANKSEQREEQNDSYCREPGPAETSNLHDTPQPVPEPSYRRETAPAEPTLRPLDRIQDNLRYYPEYLPAHYETVPRDANPRGEAQGHYYPAYDQHARRIGLEHVRYPEARPGPPAGSSSHYRAHTHRYPATNDFPRVYVGDADLRADLRALANSPPSAPGNLMSKFRVVEKPARAAQKPSIEAECKSFTTPLRLQY
ncbi:hypothetical protein PHLGIDRAFT_10059 [Phlebiopsis gigantea 11061_1 CR5-6]|uniref:Uncharacterized protein n=1 Tax=Phlebiopsis gigantea (strain 11061_1 CR5-6) TaxID=745531 RepID=A0A0C3SDX2_PHLG1|nr:hypothetical protein PHLGIDRAFT_10059 [Phlebiopsis gigantea 11061_1 CR5-6]